jgi:cyanate permease
MKHQDEAPREILPVLMATVENDLRIRPAMLGLKLLLFHAFASVVTLSLCQQFGMKIPVAGGFDLMHVFMRSGAWMCQLFCGAFYLGTSFALMSFLLPRHELSCLKQRLPSVALVFTLFSALMLAGMGEAMASTYLLAWSLGAYAAAFAGFFALKTARDLPWSFARLRSR